MTVAALSKSFGDVNAVKSVSLALLTGELLALLGPNGAGKTTLMRMLTGILEPDSGEVVLYGHQNPGRALISRHIGYCPQRIIVWRDLTCFEQLMLMADMHRLPRQRAEARATELLGILNLEGKRHALARTLSGGMQRRLSIALAMVHSPGILILDEPEAGLDPQSRVLVRDTLNQLRVDTHTSIIVSTHDMAEAELISTRVAIVNRGELLALDTAPQLILDAGKSHLVELRLESASAKERDRLAASLKKLNVPMRVSEQTIALDSDAHGAIVRPLRTIAATENIRIAELRHRKRSLEDVFLTLTSPTKAGVA